MLPELRPYVRTLHHYDVDGVTPGEHIGMPSATVTLVVALDPELDLTFAGTRQRMTSCLSGMHDSPAVIHHNGVQRGLQAALTPLGLRRLLGVPASEVSGLAVGLDDVFGTRMADSLRDRIASEPDWPARLRIFEAALTDSLLRGDARRSARSEVSRAWHLLARSGGSLPISEIAADVGWSARTLQQQFATAVGLTPKRVGRIMRFHRSMRLVGRGADFADTAARCGFADQAHMTREWTRLAGTTPSRWLRDDVLANVQDRRHAAASG